MGFIINVAYFSQIWSMTPFRSSDLVNGAFSSSLRAILRGVGLWASPHV